MSTRTGFNAVATAEINEATPKSTWMSHKSIWKQFETFWKQRNYRLEASTPVTALANIMKDWAYNMKRSNGSDYKEAVAKTVWNKTANILQEMYYNDFNRSFDPFKDVEFKSARDARNAKRKVAQIEVGKDDLYATNATKRKLQEQPQKFKRKCTAATLSKMQLLKIAKSCWDEDSPIGLQRKYFFIATHELAWRAAEATQCDLRYFRKETNSLGLPTGRIEYNTTFTGPIADNTTKWLTPNFDTPHICPVRLFDKLIGKRSPHITTNRLFLTPNISWHKPNSSGWYKNASVGINQITKWLKENAAKVDFCENESNVAEENDAELWQIETRHDSSGSVKNEPVDEQHQSDHLNNVRTEDVGNTKRCRTCLAILYHPINLREMEREHLLKILQCILEMQIQDEIFEICKNCEDRLNSVIRTKDLCVKSMQSFGSNLQCKREIKQEPLEPNEDSTNADDESKHFEDIFIKKEPETDEDNVTLVDAPITPIVLKLPVFAIGTSSTSKSLSVPIKRASDGPKRILDVQDRRKDVYLPDRPFVQCKRGPKTLSEYHLPHQVLHYSKYPMNKVMRAIAEFNTSRNVPKLRTCLFCHYIGATANRLISHMSSRHRDSMKTWCFECNLQSDNLLAHKVTKKCSYFFCKFCNKQCTPLSQAERHFRNHGDFVAPKV